MTSCGKLPDDGNETPPPLRHDAYTVGWVCALPKEQTAAIAMLDTQHTRIPNMQPSSDTNAYTLGSIGKHNIVIACLPKGRLGTVSAANVATHMITTFPSIKIGLMVGIGGGIPSNKVRLGDVVVSTPTGRHPGVVQWDIGKTKEGGMFERTGSLNNPPTFLLTALTRIESDHEMGDSKISEHLDDINRKFPKMAPKYLRSEFLRDVIFEADSKHINSVNSDEEDEYDPCSSCNKAHAIEKKPEEARIHYGLVASGNQVIKDGMFRDKLNEALGGNVLCVEMEAAGLMTNFPCLVIRGICDYADSHKNKKWQEHAAAVAAAFAKEFLAYVDADMVHAEPSVHRVLRDISGIIMRTTSKLDNLGYSLDRQSELKVLEWVTPFDYGPQQSDTFQRQHPGTCQWFLESEAFNTWLSTPGKTLYCPGIPGSGKTVITSVVAHHVTQLFAEASNVGLAYIYCSYQRYGSQTLNDLLASLLKQISQTQKALPESVKRLHHLHGEQRTRPSCAELVKALAETSQSMLKVFFLVDALDECNPSNDCRSNFMSHLSTIQEKTSVNILYTSRQIPVIENTLTGCLRQDIRAEEYDVCMFVDSQLPKALRLVPETPGLQEDIRDNIIRLVDGMFLLAELYLDSLRDKTSIKEVRQTLDEFENYRSKQNDGDGQHTLKKAYGQAVERIRNQSYHLRTLAWNTLGWIIHANRPMTANELQHALAVTKSDQMLNAENIRRLDVILSVCAGLVKVDKRSNIVRLVHLTAHEYLSASQGALFPNHQANMTTVCLTYLTFHGLDSILSYNEAPKLELGRFPFMSYAAENWGHHARKSSVLDESTLEFLSNRINVSFACGYSKPMIGTHNVMEPDETWTGLHAAAHFGLLEALEILVQRGYAVDSATSQYGITPLMVASRKGFEDCVERLLRMGAKVNATNNPGMTSLSIAASHGQAVIVKELLDNGADLNVREIGSWTPLGLACRYGHTDIVLLLLERGADVDVQTIGGQTPLDHAIHREHEAVISVLLQWKEDMRRKARTRPQTECRMSADFLPVGVWYDLQLPQEEPDHYWYDKILRLHRGDLQVILITFSLTGVALNLVTALISLLY